MGTLEKPKKPKTMEKAKDARNAVKARGGGVNGGR
jgi:hypothetical protein